MLTTVNELPTSVIQPIFSNRFRVVAEGEDLEGLTRQIKSVTLNLAERKMRLVLHETIDGAVINMMRPRTNIRLNLEFLAAGAAKQGSPDPNVTHTSRFLCTIVSHEFEMSYEYSVPAEHVFDLTF